MEGLLPTVIASSKQLRSDVFAKAPTRTVLSLRACTYGRDHSKPVAPAFIINPLPDAPNAECIYCCRCANPSAGRRASKCLRPFVSWNEIDGWRTSRSTSGGCLAAGLECSLIGTIMTATLASRGPKTKPEAAIAAPSSDATYSRREQSVMGKRYYGWWVKLGHALKFSRDRRLE